MRKMKRALAFLLVAIMLLSTTVGGKTVFASEVVPESVSDVQSETSAVSLENGVSVESAVFEPVTIIENTHGYFSGTGDDEYFYYSSWYYDLKYTITMSDGQVINGEGAGFDYDGSWRSFGYYSDGQEENHWKKGNTYTVTVDVLGYTTDVQVSIVETPVQSVSIEPISIIEGTKGYLTTDGLSNEYFAYSWYQEIDYTITMKDGQVITEHISMGPGAYVEYNGKRYSFGWSDDQWENHWKANNTYTAILQIMGYDAEVQVSIVETPVLSVNVEPITLMENSGGRYIESGPGVNQPFYYYDYSNNMKCTLEMKDGSCIKITGSSFQYDGVWQRLSCNDTQFSEPWSARNTYPITVSVLGFETQAQVSIIESPVESIEVQSIEIAENTHGSMSPSGQFHYYLSDLLTYTVKMKDGSEIKRNNGYSFEYNNETVMPNYTSNQPWYAGNTYTLTLELLGASTTFTVTIREVNQTDGFAYMLQGENAIITGSTKTDTILNIPSTIDGHTVIGITDLTDAMEYAEELVIPDSVTMFSSTLFQYNHQLKKLTLGKGISNINNEMFLYAYGLEEINVSDENPQYTSIDGVVYDKAVTKIVAFPVSKTGTYTVPDTVTNIDVLMDNLSEYNVNIKFNNNNTEYKSENGVVYNSDMTVIYACDSNQTGSYVMPDSVTTINECAFLGNSFSEITVSKNVTELTYFSFAYSVNLEKVVLPDTLKSIGDGAFYECDKLEVADLPSKLEKLDQRAFAFSGVKKVVLPSTLKEVKWGAYENAKVTELTISEGVEAIDEIAFYGTQIKSLKLPNSLTKLGESAFSNTPLETLEIGSGLQRIPNFAFESTKLKSVVIPENIKTIGHDAFANSKIETVDFKGQNIDIGDAAFYNCPIKELDLEGGKKEIGWYAFAGSDLKSVTIPKSVTDVTYKSFSQSKNLLTINVHDELESIDGYAFEGTAWWNAQPNGVVYLENYLYGYKGQMPENAEITVKDNTTLIANYAFNDDYNLKTLNISKTVRGIGYGALNACFGLEKVNVNAENSKFSTNEEGTILYNESGKAIWKKITNVQSVSYVEWGDENFRSDYGHEGVDLHVIVELLDGSTDYVYTTVPMNCITGFDPTKAGEQTVTLHLGPYTCDYTLTLDPLMVEDIKVTSKPNKTVYTQGESFAEAGLVVKGICQGGIEKDITGYTISGYDANKIGKQTITVTYEDFTTTFEVEVKAKQPVQPPKPQQPQKPVITGGWKHDGTGWWYQNADGTYPTNSWKQIDNVWYYFNASGYILTGWQSIDGAWYYFNTSGAMMTGWQSIGGVWYYFKANGAMSTGWQSINGAWYYFNTSGAMMTGWQSVGGVWYYFAGSGAMSTGWQSVGGTWYYFNTSGAMTTGWQSVGGTWYYFAGSGAMMTGWQSISGVWYYFDGSGSMATDWQSVGGVWYYFAGSGAMTTGWQSIGGAWYYLQGSGAMAANQWIGNYYLLGDGSMATNQWIGNYYVGADGCWIP